MFRAFVFLTTMLCASARRVDFDHPDDDVPPEDIDVVDRIPNGVDAYSVFDCPKECLECGQAHSFLWWGTSKNEFKCILKDSDKLVPAGTRTCSDPKPRSSGEGQSKTMCAFTDEEKANKIWEKLGKCSGVSKCCCDANDDWSKDICMPNFTPPRTTYQDERWERLPLKDQSFNNVRGSCVTEQHKAKRKQYQPGKKSAKWVSTGCCLQTEKEDVVVGNRMVDNKYGHGKYGEDIHHLSSEAIVVERTRCTFWEELYRCDKLVPDGKHTKPNKGVHPGGYLYTRVATKKGMCFGDESTPGSMQHVYGDRLADRLVDGQCPTGYTNQVAGRACHCNEDCGTDAN